MPKAIAARRIPTHHFATQCKRALLLFACLFLFATLLQACPPQVIELDPGWQSDATDSRDVARPQDTVPPDQSTESPTEQGTEPNLEQQTEWRPDLPSSCRLAKDAELSYATALPRSGEILVYGRLEQYKNTQLTITVPTGWIASTTTRTDGDGRFGFLVDRNKQKTPAGQTPFLSIKANGGLCLYNTPTLTERNLSDKRIELPQPQSCQAGSDIVVTVQVKGELQVPLILIANTPSIATHKQTVRRFKQGRTCYDLTLSCQSKGTAIFLLGTEATASITLPIQVK